MAGKDYKITSGRSVRHLASLILLCAVLLFPAQNGICAGVDGQTSTIAGVSCLAQHDPGGFFAGQITPLVRMQSEIETIEKRLDEILQFVSEAEDTELRNIEVRRARKDARLLSELVEEKSETLKKRWQETVPPDNSFAILKEIKILQMSCYTLGSQEARRYLRSKDNTYLEYFRDHIRQAEAFEKRFLDLSVKLGMEIQSQPL